MLLRRFTDFLLKNRWNAIGTTFVLAFVPVVGSISIIIAALVTLRQGVLAGSLVVIAATVPYLLGYFAGPATDQAGLVLGVIEILVISNFLTWFLAVLLRRYGSWALVIETASLIGLIVIIVAHLVNPEIQNWWSNQLTIYFSKTGDLVAKLKTDAATINEMEAMAIASVKWYATGIVTTAVLVNTLIQLLLARWWQAAMFNPGGLRKELYNIRLSYAAGAVFLIVLVLAFFNWHPALDIEPVPIAAFAAAGLSMIHHLLARVTGNLFWLVLVYLFVIWLFPVSVIIISFIALMDTWMDFRKRVKNRNSR